MVDNKVCSMGEFAGMRLVLRGSNRDAMAYRAEPPPPISRRVRRPTAAARVVRASGAGVCIARAHVARSSEAGVAISTRGQQFLYGPRHGSICLDRARGLPSPRAVLSIDDRPLDAQYVTAAILAPDAAAPPSVTRRSSEAGPSRHRYVFDTLVGMRETIVNNGLVVLD